MNIGHCGATNDYLLFEQLVARKKEELKNFYKSNQCLGILVVGPSCNNIFHNEIPLSSEQSIKMSLKSAVATSYFPSMVRPAAAPLIRALFEFMKFLNWQKLGIITEIGNTYFPRTAETVYSEAKNNSNASIDISHHILANSSE